MFGALCNLLLAHGMALRAMRAAPGGEQLFIGIATTGRLCYPESETPDCIAAARQATWAVPEDDWMFTHHMVLDPICRGTSRLHRHCARPSRRGRACRRSRAHARRARFSRSQHLQRAHGAPGCLRRARRMCPYRGFPRTAMKWPVTPEVMHWGVRFVYERYGLPLFISENGQSCNDRIFLDGKVHDPDRIDFLHRYLLELAKAAAAGADVRGYLHWCFTDNFEWSHGYKERFGLVYVDYSRCGASPRTAPPGMPPWPRQTAKICNDRAPVLRQTNAAPGSVPPRRSPRFSVRHAPAFSRSPCPAAREKFFHFFVWPHKCGRAAGHLFVHIV